MIDLFRGQSMLCAFNLPKQKLDRGKIEGGGIGIYLEQFDGSGTENGLAFFDLEQLDRLSFGSYVGTSNIPTANIATAMLVTGNSPATMDLSVTIHGPSPSLPALNSGYPRYRILSSEHN